MAHLTNLKSLHGRVYNYKRNVEEKHPLAISTDLPIEQRYEQLRELTAQLWDQVWWMGLPFYRRWFYRWQGFSAPISKFYEEVDRRGD